MLSTIKTTASTTTAILYEKEAPPVGTTYYIHTDHLGSYTLISDQNKNRVDSLWFDAWGNRRQYNNWANTDTCTSFLFYRGFTGHEHLDLFKIINMNGRLYDPVIARFFSPDPFVQMPEFTQGYNRYTYCLNNPLIYTDPSGEIVWFVPVIIGAVIGTYAGGQTPISISLGVASYDFTNGTFGYLGKEGNKWYQNMGYTFGAMANLSDIVSLFGGGTNVKAITEKKDAISHAAVVNEAENINISVGPKGGGYFNKNQSFGGKVKNLFKMVEGDGDWQNHSIDGNGWDLSINNVNKNIMQSLSTKLASGQNFVGQPLQYSGIGFSCVSYASRAFTLKIGI
jgi:RHS repeat-associated protein